MKTKNFFFFIGLLLSLGLITQCEKYGKPGGDMEADPDSDRPAWAGGNTDANDHNKKGDSGGKPGVDYGDKTMLDRDENGVPILSYLGYTDDEGEDVEMWVLRPTNEEGDLLEIYTEGETAGELKDPEAAVEVDFGRLNIVKSPPSVLNQALNEALGTLTETGAKISLDFCGRLTSTWPVDPDAAEEDMVYNVKTIDSPRENMALYKYLMQNLYEGDDNKLAFLKEELPEFNSLDIAASCFAAGSDKTGVVDIDEVVYINGMIDCYGINPIENCCVYTDYEDEYGTVLDAQELNREGYVRQYFNFGGSGKDVDNPYKYNRERYEKRYLQFLVWNDIYYPVNEEGYSEGPIWTVKQVGEGTVGDWGSVFRGGAWTDNKSHVEGFTVAIDDAVQMLDFVHGDSNIREVPYSEDDNPYPEQVP